MPSPPITCLNKYPNYKFIITVTSILKNIFAAEQFDHKIVAVQNQGRAFLPQPLKQISFHFPATIDQTKHAIKSPLHG